MDENSKVTIQPQNGSNKSNQPVDNGKKHRIRKPLMENVPYTNEAKEKMKQNALFKKLYRTSSNVPVSKICEDCAISHASLENLEKGVDSKHSTHYVYLIRLLEYTGRVFHLATFMKEIILANLYGQIITAKRRDKHEVINDPKEVCVFDFAGSEHSAEEELETLHDLQEEIDRFKEEQNVERNEEEEEDDE